MKKILFIFGIFGTLFISCNNTSKTKTKGSGACTKCNCPSFREDPELGTCMNTRPPTAARCNHSASDHK